MVPKNFFNLSGREFPDYSKISFDSMLVKNGLVSEIGFSIETISSYSHLPQFDLLGATVLPAFADAHVHFFQTALTMVGISFSKATSLNDVFDLIRDFSKKSPDEWILGWNLDETNLLEGRLPTMLEIDAVVPKRKVWLSRIDLHSAIANSEAVRWADSNFKKFSHDQGRFQREDYIRISGHVYAGLPDSLKRKGLNIARSKCFEKGVSTIHALEGGWNISDKDVQLTADFLSEPGLHGVIYHQSEDLSLARKNNWPRLGGCLLVDGSFGSRTAALKEPYADSPQSCGNLYRDPAQLRALIRFCFQEKVQLAMHAIGDLAIDNLVNAHLWVAEQLGAPPLAHRIEHFELPEDFAIFAARDASLFLSVQPAFEVLWGGPKGMYFKRLGAKRVLKTNPFRTILSRGIPIAGGSDSPVTPIDPFLGIHGFVNHPNPEEQIDLNRAISAFVLEPHRFSGENKIRGKLQPGYRADFICLKQDPFLTPRSELRNLEISRLFAGGEEIRR